MTLMTGTVGMLTITPMLFQVSYQRDTPSAFDGSYYPEAPSVVPSVLPHMGVVTDAGLENWRFGLGVAIPLAQGVDWDAEYAGRPASTRYYALSATDVHIYLEPTVAYRINKYISIAAGMDIIAVSISESLTIDFSAQINQMTCTATETPPHLCPVNSPLPRENPAFDGVLRVNGLGFGVGGFAGVMVTPLPWLRLGLAFHSGAGSVEVPTDVSIDVPEAAKGYLEASLPGSALPALEGKLKVPRNSPWMVNAGVAARPTEELEIAADLHWINSSANQTLFAPVVYSTISIISDQLMINTKDDIFIVGLRGAYRVLPRLLVAMRLQYDANTYQEPFVTPVSMDFHLIKIQLGISWRATSWLTIQSEYSHQFAFSRTIQTSHFAPNSLPTTPQEISFDRPSPTGYYTYMADRWTFGAQFHF